MSDRLQTFSIRLIRGFGVFWDFFFFFQVLHFCDFRHSKSQIFQKTKRKTDQFAKIKLQIYAKNTHFSILLYPDVNTPYEAIKWSLCVLGSYWAVTNWFGSIYMISYPFWAIIWDLNVVIPTKPVKQSEIVPKMIKTAPNVSGNDPTLKNHLGGSSELILV